MFLKNLEFKSLDSLKTLTYQPLINYTPENGVNFNFLYTHTYSREYNFLFLKKKLIWSNGMVVWVFHINVINVMR